MATRNGQPIDLIWVLFNVAGQAIANFTNEANEITQADPRTENCQASVNVKKPNGPQQALVKVVADSGWIETLPVGLQNQIDRVFTEDDHDEAVAIVTSAEWLPL
jgi:hypothetical protein